LRPRVLLFALCVGLQGCTAAERDEWVRHGKTAAATAAPLALEVAGRLWELDPVQLILYAGVGLLALFVLARLSKRKKA